MIYSEIIDKFGFPIISTVGISYMIYYVWRWVTTEITPLIKAMLITMNQLSEQERELIALIDLMNQKLNLFFSLTDRK